MTRVGDKEDPDPDDIFSFSLNGMTMAVLSNLQAEDPLEWKIKYIPYQEVIPGGSLNQAGVDQDYLYVFRHADKGTYLIRIPHHALHSPAEAAAYWSTEETWKPGSEGDDAKIHYSGQANGSLDYFPELGCWIHVYGPNFMSNEIGCRYAPDITGPWTETRPLYACPEQIPGDPSYDQRHFCYLARVHPLFSDLESGKMTVIYDCNSTEFFHAAGSDEIYIPVVVELDIPPEILSAPETR
jgi:hypothetical protein